MVVVRENDNAQADDSQHDYDVEHSDHDGNVDLCPNDNALPPLSTSLFSLVPDCESEENGIKEERLR